MSALADLLELADAARTVKMLLERQLEGWPSTAERRTLIARLELALEHAEPLTSKVLTVPELAIWWKVSTPTVRGWIDDGRLEAFNVGRSTVPRWRITVAAACRFAAIGDHRGSAPRGTTEN